MASLPRALWRIYQAKIDQLYARSNESRCYLLDITFQPCLETRKLAPVSIKTDTA
jgi:hypothetical protein